MDEQDIKALIARYNNGTATPDERNWLDNWYRAEASRQQLSPGELPLPEQEERLLQGTLERAGLYPPSPVRRLWPRIAAAASILIACGTGLYFYQHNKPQSVTQQAMAKHDIAPGHNQATLTLANGQKIVLTKNLSGQIATQGRTNISASNQNIVYQNTQHEDQVSYNSLTTARGEQSPYPLVLADGTKVWLNAESTLTFPTAFPGKERIVKLTGEAYFEVKHNTAQPFKVQATSQTIEDIGTSFNVNAYANEPATLTTLVEGSVKVNKLILKPNEQTDGTKTLKVNAARYIAWKNHDFFFENDDIRTVMRQLARWYNIEVVYDGPVSTDGFNAVLSRDKNISAILHGLEKTKGVHFKIEGRRVNVSK